MPTRQKVLAIDHVPDLLLLFETLLGELGYETATVLMGESVMEEVRRFRPNLILMDLMRGRGDDMVLLDQLRVDPATQGVPVVALSTDAWLLEQAVASYNVDQVIVKPFDVEDLAQKTRAALRRAPLASPPKPVTGPPKPVFEEVVRGLAAESRAMMIRWVQQVLAREPYRERHLRLAELIDHVPLLLQATMVALQVDDFRRVFELRPDMKDAACSHARARRGQSISLLGIVGEYQFLRNEIWCEVAGILQGKGTAPGDVLDLVTRVDYVLDAILRITIETFERRQAGESTLF